MKPHIRSWFLSSKSVAVPACSIRCTAVDVQTVDLHLARGIWQRSILSEDVLPLGTAVHPKCRVVAIIDELVGRLPSFHLTDACASASGAVSSAVGALARATTIAGLGAIIQRPRQVGVWTLLCWPRSSSYDSHVTRPFSLMQQSLRRNDDGDDDGDGDEDEDEDDEKKKERRAEEEGRG